jgi:hypothetical protein
MRQLRVLHSIATLLLAFLAFSALAEAAFFVHSEVASMQIRPIG